MRTEFSGNRISLLVLSGTLGMFIFASEAAQAEYYVVTGPSCGPPPCIIYKKVIHKPCHVKKVVKKRYHCYRPKYYRPQYTCEAPKRPSCYKMAVYYPVPQCNTSCGNVYYGASFVTGPMPSEIVTEYGTPVYRPNTYHPDFNWDMRTGDDF